VVGGREQPLREPGRAETSRLYCVDEDAARLAGWVERTVHGTVTRVDRMPRWRPAWDIDVEVEGRSLPLHARGEREPRIVMPYRIADEVAVHELLESHGLPVPHAFGLCDDPYALVMDPWLRSLRPDRASARASEESWPAGAIPGTR
jgi:hypothetical protein